MNQAMHLIKYALWQVLISYVFRSKVTSSPDTWKRLISITNCILLRALFGLCINNKNMHGVNKVKYGNKCFEFSRCLDNFSRWFTVKLPWSLSWCCVFCLPGCCREKMVNCKFTYYLKMHKLSSGHIALSDMISRNVKWFSLVG